MNVIEDKASKPLNTTELSKTKKDSNTEKHWYFKTFSAKS